MTRATIWLLAAGVLLFVGLLVSQGLPRILTTLAVIPITSDRLCKPESV
jgi:hypothetical protein